MEIETRVRSFSPIKYYKEYYILQILYILRYFLSYDFLYVHQHPQSANDGYFSLAK